MPTSTGDTTDQASGDVQVVSSEGLLTLRLNRPASFNALTAPMTARLLDELHGAVSRDDLRVVLLTGAGTAFSAGADLSGDDPAATYDDRAVEAAARLTDAVLGCDKPVVCGLNGIAAGVGLSLALACDLVVATESAGLTLGFTKVGLMPDGGATASVAASVGRATAMRMALTNEVVGAREALVAGLVTHVFADDDYAAGLDGLLGRLASGPPLAFAATKRAINAATLGGLAGAHARELQGQQVLLGSRDASEGMRAFLEGRRPHFVGE